MLRSARVGFAPPLVLLGEELPVAAPGCAGGAAPARVGAGGAVVGCGERKAAEAAPARALYTGSLMRVAMRHADWAGHPWFVVSALWGLVEPWEVVEPYNVRVTELEPDDRVRLGEEVARVLRERVPRARVEAHAGEAYLRVVRGPLQAQGFTVEAPLAGMEIGERLRWYSSPL